MTALPIAARIHQYLATLAPHVRERDAALLLAEAAVMGGWIRVSERLPDHTDTVIVCDADGVWFAYRNKMGVWFDPCNGCIPENVTHWMPLPEPPSNS